MSQGSGGLCPALTQTGAPGALSVSESLRVPSWLICKMGGP